MEKVQDSSILVVDQNLWDTMTETEQDKYFHELLRKPISFILNGIRYDYDSNLGPVSTTFGGSSRKSKSNSE
jgi:hypothetical protein